MVNHQGVRRTPSTGNHWAERHPPITVSLPLIINSNCFGTCIFTSKMVQSTYNRGEQSTHWTIWVKMSTGDVGIEESVEWAFHEVENHRHIPQYKMDKWVLCHTIRVWFIFFNEGIIQRNPFEWKNSYCFEIRAVWWKGTRALLHQRQTPLLFVLFTSWVSHSKMSGLFELRWGIVGVFGSKVHLFCVHSTVWDTHFEFQFARNFN